ncbi:MAG: hypothetical protein FWC42_07135 [Proteobacteria bacterium]|nr:hypothetical protein [Pseudomonadota bacterium]
MPSSTLYRFAAIVLLVAVLLFGLSYLSTCTEKTEAPPTAEAVTKEAVPATKVTTKETSPATETASVPQLPPEARKTLSLIYQGGPFSYSRDGIVFSNREKQLPTKPHGYYREYTVPTPGAVDRGARRIVCGGRKPSEPDLCYYTADHYRSFRLIRNETVQP